MTQIETEKDPWTTLKEQIQTELEQYRRELKEVVLMLEQSQLEVNKLAQRNASITAHLQQTQVSGMRSPSSSALRITNWPGLALSAILGASISLRITLPSDISSRLTILNISNLQPVN